MKVIIAHGVFVLLRTASRWPTSSSAQLFRMVSAAAVFVTLLAGWAKGCWSASASITRARMVFVPFWSNLCCSDTDTASKNYVGMSFVSSFAAVVGIAAIAVMLRGGV